MAAVGVEKGRSDRCDIPSFFVQSTKSNSPMIATDTIMHYNYC